MTSFSTVDILENGYTCWKRSKKLLYFSYFYLAKKIKYSTDMETNKSILNFYYPPVRYNDKLFNCHKYVAPDLHCNIPSVKDLKWIHFDYGIYGILLGSVSKKY